MALPHAQNLADEPDINHASRCARPYAVPFRSAQRDASAASAKQIEHHAAGHDLRRRLLKPELVGPSHHRTEQELVIQHNGYGHRADRPTDRREIALLDSAGDIGADTGKRYPNVAN